MALPTWPASSRSQCSSLSPSCTRAPSASVSLPESSHKLSALAPSTAPQAHWLCEGQGKRWDFLPFYQGELHFLERDRKAVRLSTHSSRVKGSLKQEVPHLQSLLPPTLRMACRPETPWWAQAPECPLHWHSRIWCTNYPPSSSAEIRAGINKNTRKKGIFRPLCPITGGRNWPSQREGLEALPMGGVEP